MFLKRILPIGLIILTTIFGLWRYNNPPRVENADYTYQNGWQGENPFEIRLERIPEKCIFMPALGGANYIFSTRPNGSEKWQTVFTTHHDDLIDISSDNVRVLNEKVAYTFVIQKFAATTDSGKTWKIWSPSKDLIDWKRSGDEYPNWALIEQVEIKEDGSGKIELNRFDKEGLIKELRTKDFGQTWNP